MASESQDDNLLRKLLPPVLLGSISHLEDDGKLQVPLNKTTPLSYMQLKLVRNALWISDAWAVRKVTLLLPTVAVLCRIRELLAHQLYT